MDKNILTIDQVRRIVVDDFLKQADCITDCYEVTDETEASPSDPYVCQNPKCLQNEHACFHLFEIDGDTTVVICNKCYDLGVRFCLFTHEILSMDQMEPVLDNMYAQPLYHQGQLDHDHLSSVNDMYQYFKSIGVDNPNPTHVVINLNQEDTTDETVT
jgi:hypothetical protein